MKKVDEQLTSKQNYHQLFIQKHKNTQHTNTQRQTQKRNTAIRKRNTNTPYTNTHIERNTAARKRNTNTPPHKQTHRQTGTKKTIFLRMRITKTEKSTYTYTEEKHKHTPYTNRHTNRQKQKNHLFTDKNYKDRVQTAAQKRNTNTPPTQTDTQTDRN